MPRRSRLRPLCVAGLAAALLFTMAATAPAADHRPSPTITILVKHTDLVDGLDIAYRRDVILNQEPANIEISADACDHPELNRCVDQILRAHIEGFATVTATGIITLSLTLYRHPPIGDVTVDQFEAGPLAVRRPLIYPKGDGWEIIILPTTPAAASIR